jgi:hypothetical protein
LKIAPLIAFAVTAPALALALPARSATGMAAMQYYVGSWSCTGGTIGKKTLHATIKYTMDGDVLQDWIHVSDGYVQSSSLSYDSKNDRYVNAGVANDNTWFVNYTTLSGNTETGIDHARSDGKLGRGITVRTSSTSFTYTGYPNASAAKPDFKATCQKS